MTAAKSIHTLHRMTKQETVSLYRGHVDGVELKIEVHKQNGEAYTRFFVKGERVSAEVYSLVLRSLETRYTR